MKVSAINNVRYNKVNVSKTQHKIKVNDKSTIPAINENINFKGKVRLGGTIGSVVGTLAGVGIGAIATVATGGLAAPLLLGAAGCAAGAISGDIIDHKIRPGDDDNTDDFDPTYPNHHDY